RHGPALQRHINRGSPPGGLLHPALPLPEIAFGGATQAASRPQYKPPVWRRWTRKGRHDGALSPLSSYQLVIAYKGLPLASLISLFQYFSTSAATLAGIGT